MLEVLMKDLPLSELFLRQLWVGHQDLHLTCQVVAESWILRSTVLSWWRIRSQGCVWSNVWATRASRQISISCTVDIFLYGIDGLVLTHLDQCTRHPNNVPSSTAQDEPCSGPKRIKLAVAPWADVVPLFSVRHSIDDLCSSLTDVDTVLRFCFHFGFCFSLCTCHNCERSIEDGATSSAFFCRIHPWMPIDWLHEHEVPVDVCTLFARFGKMSSATCP